MLLIRIVVIILEINKPNKKKKQNITYSYTVTT